MKVNKERLSQSLSQFASIGATADGGVTRLGLSALEYQANSLLCELAREAGLAPRRDEFSSVFCRREGADPDLPAILFGSHLDTVPNGGKFDGAAGTLAALEVVRTLSDHSIVTRHPLELVSFAIEESSRFGIAMVASQVMMGTLDIETFLGLKDKGGKSPAEALLELGLNADYIRNARRNPEEIFAFVELHIEQGRVLEECQIPIGIVSAIAKATRYRMELRGQEDHSGTTPMFMRRDAAAAAAEIIVMVEGAVKDLGAEPSVATVGVVRVEPGAMNVIPGSASLGVDIRDIDGLRKRRIADAVCERAQEICSRRGIDLSIKKLEDGEPVPLSPQIVEIMGEAARSLGLKSQLMPSGAGHDAMNLAPKIPTGMIFIPCRAGRSHCPDEFATIDDIAAGAQVLLETVLRIDREDSLRLS